MYFVTKTNIILLYIAKLYHSIYNSYYAAYLVTVQQSELKETLSGQVSTLMLYVFQENLQTNKNHKEIMIIIFIITRFTNLLFLISFHT